MSTARKIIENIWPNKKLFVRLQELLSSISNDEKKGHILLSIEKMNHSREFCQLTLTELELIYVFVPRKDRSFYECICDKDIIKSYIDFEYLLKNNPLVDNNRAIICCLKILFYHLNNLSNSNIINQIDLSSILKEFLVLDAYVRCFRIRSYK
jgi:hypothetical protein